VQPRGCGGAREELKSRHTLKKVQCIVILHRIYTRALTFETLAAPLRRSYSNPASISRRVKKVRRRKSTEDNKYDEFKAVEQEREKKRVEISLKRTFSNPLPPSLPGSRRFSPPRLVSRETYNDREDARTRRFVSI
jgi:hypothetical protein